MKIAGREEYQPVDFLPRGQLSGGRPDATKMGQIVCGVILRMVRQYPALKSLLPVNPRSIGFPLSEGQPRA